MWGFDRDFRPVEETHTDAVIYMFFFTKLIPVWCDGFNVELEIILKIEVLNFNNLSKLFFFALRNFTT
jgi:hypothetical protein